MGGHGPMAPPLCTPLPPRGERRERRGGVFLPTRLFHSLNLLKFKDIYRYYVAIYMFKNIASFRPIHNLNTRSRDLALPSFNRLTLCQHSITFNGPKIWNDIPSDLRNLVSLNIFKS